MTHPPDGNPSFRGSCVRDGRHVYKSVDIAGFIGSAVIKKYGWKVDLTNFDLEIVCILFHDQMFAGIALADPTRFAFKNRLANEDRSHLSDIKYISTLRPSTAYMMFQLAQQELGDIFLDSMCGVGTIPACCSEFSQNRIFSLGGEIDEGAVKKAGVNASLKARHVGICQWDSTMLPLRPKSIDKIVIDMPFGVRCGSHRNNSKV
jgi:tRNA G10  N-methylase Trm11